MWSNPTLRKINNPIPPARSVWADKTKSQLQDINTKRQELDRMEHEIVTRCNHTMPDGTSTLKPVIDDEPDGDNRTYNRCTACQKCV